MAGVERMLWLDRGLEGDHTDGHIDTITRFVDERTIVTVTCDDPARRQLCRRHARELRELRSFRDSAGRDVHDRRAALAAQRVEFDGTRLPLTYANFYIANGGVVVPVYGDARDALALEILRPLFPGRTVVGCPRGV